MDNFWTVFVKSFCGQFLWTHFVDSPLASKLHDFDSLSNCWKSLGQCGKTVSSGESLGCLHCAAGPWKGSLGNFLGKTLGCKTLSLHPKNPLGAFTLSFSTLSAPIDTLIRGQFFHTAPRIFNSRFHSVLVQGFCNLLVYDILFFTVFWWIYLFVQYSSLLAVYTVQHLSTNHWPADKCILSHTISKISNRAQKIRIWLRSSCMNAAALGPAGDGW